MKKLGFMLPVVACSLLAFSSPALSKWISPEVKKETKDAIRALRQEIKELDVCNSPNHPSDPACKAAKDALREEIKQVRASGHI